VDILKISTNSDDCQDMFPVKVYTMHKKERSRIYELLKIRCLHSPYKKKIFGNDHCIR